MKKYIAILAIIICSSSVFADGLIIPEGNTYPDEVLKNKSTSIEVNIRGLIAETVVYQEFENESDAEINGVYSFPLPMNARTTRLMYSKGDTLIDAVLKVKAQTQNPGTGEGGTVALINQYMGKNALRLRLSNIAPHSIKGIRLHYISTLTNSDGTAEYIYPLDVSDFVKTQLDYLKIKINVSSSTKIENFALPDFNDFFVSSETDTTLKITCLNSKVYPAKDIRFSYSTDNSNLSLDVFSWKPDTTDGYFTIVARSEAKEITERIPQKLMFLICNSTTMSGIKLDQSKFAVNKCLDQLGEQDSFNIAVYNSVLSQWQGSYVPATSDNITQAKTYVDAITFKYGNRTGSAIKQILSTNPVTGTLMSILAFTDGKGTLDPYEIEEANIHKTGIFLVAIGNDYDRARLETLANLNFGFVCYLTNEDNLSDEIVNVFKRISYPLYKDINIDYLDPMVHDLYPAKIPALYANSDVIISGRYSLPGWAQIKISGFGYLGMQMFPFDTKFANSYDDSEFCRNMWVRNAMDNIEASLLIYGEADSLKNKLIALSLANNMRCRYTSYLEDSIYKELGDDIYDDEFGSTPINTSTTKAYNKITKLGPVPLNITSCICINLQDGGNSNSRFIRIYNIKGEIVKTIKISDVMSGEIEISLSELMGSNLKGIYIITLEIDHNIEDFRKVIL
ncbi:VIT domain-containing protein [Saccharicrinis sp. FJH54]|uniref:VIT domain-containing protein n=1 Tax=Saccharicrinis sp. FJH54 TaxID=3344665 RepID=UPI0035D450C8